MKKETSAKNKVRLDTLVRSLDGIENASPRTFKVVFNFKGRKSSQIARIAFETLSDEGDIIFDPFMGSGAFVIAAIQANRKIIATEIDNYTFSAVYTLLSKVDLKKLESLFNDVAKNIKNSVMSLYETICCGSLNYISKLMYDPETPEFFNPTPNREIINGENIKLLTACPVCGKTRKKFDNVDQQKLDSVELEDISTFPKDHYIENSRINITCSTGADRYDRIFTMRSKKALLLIQEAILSLKPSIERDVIEHSLVSALTLARIAMYGSSSDILYHVVPFGAQESNVWELFENKFNSFITFKKQYSSLLSDNPSSDDRFNILLTPYQDYCASLSNNQTFDLIYTDFPYTDQVPYLERNQLYRIWLNTFYNPGAFSLTNEMLEKEIVQTNAPSRPRKKDINVYYSDINQMFEYFQTILKDDGLVVLTVKLGKSKYFQTLIEIINLARKNGFEYTLRFGIDKNDPSLRKQSAYSNTLSNEMIVAFEKLPKSERYWYIGNVNFEFETIKLIYQLVDPKNKRDVTITQAVKHIQDTLRKHNHIANENDIHTIERIIRSNFVVEEKTLAVRVDYNKIYLDIEDRTDLFTKFYNFVPIIIRRLLDVASKFVLDDLYFEIANTFCTGNPGIIKQFLDDKNPQNSIERLLNNYCTKSGKFYIKKEYESIITDGAVDISTLEGTDFEKHIKRLLEAEGFTDVFISGGSGDLGVDLIATKIENDIEKIYLFQCKRWAANVGIIPIQQLISERQRRNADVAVCVTTSDYTPDGKFAATEGDVETWNGEEVIRRFDLQFPGDYYHGSISI